jgi:hypothetical protein
MNDSGACVINGKAVKAALFQSGGGADYAQPLALPHLKFFVITPLSVLTFEIQVFSKIKS